MNPQDPTVPATETPVYPIEPASDGLNLLPTLRDKLKQDRGQIGRNATPISLKIPGFGGDLVAVYRWIDADELAATAESLKKIKNLTQQQIAAAADALGATNDAILMRNAEGQLEPVTDHGEAVTFENGASLVAALGLPAPRSTRECVEAIFGNTYAVVGQATRVMEWLEDTSTEVDQAYLGE